MKYLEPITSGAIRLEIQSQLVGSEDALTTTHVSRYLHDAAKTEVGMNLTSFVKMYLIKKRLEED